MLQLSWVEDWKGNYLLAKFQQKSWIQYFLRKKTFCVGLMRRDKEHGPIKLESYATPIGRRVRLFFILSWIGLEL